MTLLTIFLTYKKWQFDMAQTSKIYLKFVLQVLDIMSSFFKLLNN